jgi:CheY-like chemotaxis protein
MAYTKDIQNLICDGKTLDLLRNIGVQSYNKTKLTRRQYYSRVAKLTKAGLIRSNKGEYFLTSLGKVIYKYTMVIERALDNHWKLKALDSLVALDCVPIEECKKLIDKFFRDDYEIKEIILAESEWRYSSSSTTKIENKTETSTAAAMVIEKQQQRQLQKEHPLKIMLVEDEADVLLTYKKFLDSESYNVDAFTNPYDALQSFIEKNGRYYDLLVLDIRMPGINGLQLYRQLKAIDKSVKILFISALDAAEEAVSVLGDVDSSNIVRKPISKEDFVKKVKEVFS